MRHEPNCARLGSKEALARQARLCLVAVPVRAPACSNLAEMAQVVDGSEALVAPKLF